MRAGRAVECGFAGFVAGDEGVAGDGLLAGLGSRWRLGA